MPVFLTVSFQILFVYRHLFDSKFIRIVSSGYHTLVSLSWVSFQTSFDNSIDEHAIFAARSANLHEQEKKRREELYRQDENTGNEKTLPDRVLRHSFLFVICKIVPLI